MAAFGAVVALMGAGSAQAAVFNLGTLNPPYNNSVSQTIDLGSCNGELCDQINFTTTHTGLVDITYLIATTDGTIPSPTFDGFELTYNGDGAGDGDGSLVAGDVFTIANILTLIPDAIWYPGNPGRFRTASLQDGSWTLAVNRIDGSGMGVGTVSIVTPIPAALPLAASAFMGLGGLAWLRRRGEPTAAQA